MKPIHRLAAAVLSTLAIATTGAIAQDNVLRMVPHSNLVILDPIWTTAYMSRNHGYMIYDTLFGTDEKNQIQGIVTGPGNFYWNVRKD